MKYFVESFYNDMPDAAGNTVDYTIIGPAQKGDIERDGDNWCGRYDGYRFNLHESLEDAITNAGYLASKITFVDLSEEETKKSNEIVQKLMANEDYIKKFGLDSGYTDKI